MKKINLILLFAVTALSTSFGQYIKTGVSSMKADDPAMQQQMESMMKSMTLETYALGDTIASYMNYMGGMVTSATFSNTVNQGFIMYMDMMGNKMKIVPTAAELAEITKENEAKSTDVKIEEIPGDTKEILGFKCKKYKITTQANGQDMDFFLYVAPDLKIQQTNIQGMEGIKLDGFPLEYTVDMAGIKMTFSALKYEPTFDKAKMSPPKGNYKEINFTEFKKQMPGM